MPVFDWVRTQLRHRLPDGSYTMAYQDALVQGTAQETMERMNANNTGGHKLPGWEPERLVHLQELLEAYAPLGAEGLAENFKYFIQAIMPTCEQYDVKMAMHPDDPPKALFGLPRIATDAQDLRRIESFYDSPYNGFTLCTGSLGENRAIDVPALIREFAGRDKVPFAQIRNIKFTSDVDFHESAHPSAYGSLDMYEIMLERGRPGYGLYDRALGTSYLSGLWEAIQGQPLTARSLGGTQFQRRVASQGRCLMVAFTASAEQPSVVRKIAIRMSTPLSVWRKIDRPGRSSTSLDRSNESIRESLGSGCMMMMSLASASASSRLFSRLPDTFAVTSTSSVIRSR